jgi:flagellar hook-basal body complex protein FliE
MSVNFIKPAFDAYKKIESITKPESNSVQAPTKQGGQSFGDMLSSAIKEVDGLQKTAQGKVEDLVLGKSANPHDAMIALEKADAAFQLMNAVRSKIVRAYEEVMRAQV